MRQRPGARRLRGRRRMPAVQVHGADERLEDVGAHGRELAAALGRRSLAEQDGVVQPDRLGGRRRATSPRRPRRAAARARPRARRASRGRGARPRRSPSTESPRNSRRSYSAERVVLDGPGRVRQRGAKEGPVRERHTERRLGGGQRSTRPRRRAAGRGLIGPRDRTPAWRYGRRSRTSCSSRPRSASRRRRSPRSGCRRPGRGR